MNTKLSCLNYFAFAVVTLSLFTSSVQATDSQVTLLSFQMGTIFIPSGRDSHLSGEVAWTPTLGLGLLGVRGELGLTLFGGQTSQKYIVINSKLFLQVNLFPG